MAPFIINPIKYIKGRIVAPSDKSITHRAIILSSLSSGKTLIKNFTASRDCLYTLKAFKEMGVSFRCRKNQTDLIVAAKGMYGLKKPKSSLYMGGSGTTIRLLAGILAAQRFDTKIETDDSLSKRPMLRIIKPLRLMGADIIGCKRNGKKIEEYPPLVIRGCSLLKAVKYKSDVSSAQVKSCILLAALFAQGMTCVKEKIGTRDHTERMLRSFGVKIKVLKNTISVLGPAILSTPGEIDIPGDISSVAFFIIGAIILPGSRLEIQNVGLNPTRLGLVRALKRMGANIECRVCFVRGFKRDFEPKGTIIVRSSKLKGVTLSPSEVPSLIDELPILMVAACFAEGETKLKGIEELRVKETDRVGSMFYNLKNMGADINIVSYKNGEGIVIKGKGCLRGAKLYSFADHRTVMSLVIAALAANGASQIDNIDCVDKSFPEFFEYLRKMAKVS